MEEGNEILCKENMDWAFEQESHVVVQAGLKFCFVSLSSLILPSKW